MWQIKEATSTGTVVNNLETDVPSVIIGKSLGIIFSPLMILKIEIPTAMTRKTAASPIDNADVNLNESARTIFLILTFCRNYKVL